MVLLLALAGSPVHAAGPGGDCPPGQNDCNVWDDDPGVPGGPGGGSTGGGGSGDGATPKCQWDGRVIPCYDNLLGWFNNSDGCYYKLEEPQPEAPDGKQWYLRTCNGGDLGDQSEVLLDAPPPGYGAPPDPEELARRALASISLLPPRIAVAPRRSKGPGLVGLPVWMWASSGPGYFGPLTASASDRGLTVEITAQVDRIVWTMGDGQKVTCTGPGTPYAADGPLAGLTSPDCGYDPGYARAGTYRVSATTFWTVHWSGGGESGDIAQSRVSGTVPVQINELQVVAR
ncbi:hypothetical protein ONA70_04965 [Micromonospora yasonensis]|uniref:hypothetical protein n=1 Tax=Micromonospora yasonensis TaxID=1128667 RepID=UPI00222E18A1|nr:hypothetical protein [Micromonospora yasonensis]MCW3839447.1 hypothetical protein [Micromonospora yasonensis]